MKKFSTEREKLSFKIMDLAAEYARIKARTPHAKGVETTFARLQEAQRAYKALGIPNPDRLTLVPSLKKDGES